MWPLLAACDASPRPDCGVRGPHLLVAATDYQSGVLGAVSLDGTCVAEPLASAGQDPLVRAIGDRVAYADRTRGDAVRIYVPGRYDAPEHEFALPPGGNTHDVVRVGDELWFSRYAEAALTVTDLRGRRLGAIDLSPWADADGVPEADRFAWVGDRLFLALQRLDRAQLLQTAGGPGLVLELDPASREVVAATEVGEDPKLWPGRGSWLATTGLFFGTDGAVVRGTDAGVETLATEADLGFDATMAADTDAGLVVFGLDAVDTEPSHVVCGSIHARTDDFPVELAQDAAGEVFGASREMDWLDPPSGERRAWHLDAGSCGLDPLGDPLLLGPQSVALVVP